MIASIALVVWRATAGRRGVLARVLGSIAAPAAAGLAALMVLLVILNSLRLSASNGAVAAIEGFLIDLRLVVAEATKMPLWLFAAVIGLLIALTHAVPHLRAVSTFVETKKRVGQFVAALTAITSFTLFAQNSGGDLIEKHYADVMTRFEASVRREQAAVARAAAADAVSAELRSFSPGQKAQFRAVIQRMYKADSDKVAVDIAASRLVEGLPHPPEPPPSQPGPELRTPPRSREAYADDERRAEESSFRAAEAERVAAESEKGAEKIVGEMVGALLPELPGYAGKFVSKTIEMAAERFYTPVVKRMFSSKVTVADEIRSTTLTANAKVVDASVLQSVASDTERAAVILAKKRENSLEKATELATIGKDWSRIFRNGHPGSDWPDFTGNPTALEPWRISPLHLDPLHLGQERQLDSYHPTYGYHPLEMYHPIEFHPTFHPIP